MRSTLQFHFVSYAYVPFCEIRNIRNCPSHAKASFTKHEISGNKAHFIVKYESHFAWNSREFWMKENRMSTLVSISLWSQPIQGSMIHFFQNFYMNISKPYSKKLLFKKKWHYINGIFFWPSFTLKTLLYLLFRSFVRYKRNRCLILNFHCPLLVIMINNCY